MMPCKPDAGRKPPHAPGNDAQAPLHPYAGMRLNMHMAMSGHSSDVHQGVRHPGAIQLFKAYT
jgi:hypothetical protein